MSGPLQGKNAIVTGASRGIGAAIAEKLASLGADVTLNYTSDSSAKLAEAVAAKLASGYKVKVGLVQADVSTKEGAKAIVDKALEIKQQVDILVNNAGVAPTNWLPDVTEDEFTRAYRINVLGPLLVLQAAHPYLPTDRSGRIVNCSSVSATLGFITQTVYGGTKAALDAMTRTWARELSERCTVNSLSLGPVLTEMYDGVTEEFVDHIRPFFEHAPLTQTRSGYDSEELIKVTAGRGGRPAYPKEVSDIAAFLCSSESSWMTGQVVSANGGMIMSTF